MFNTILKNYANLIAGRNINQIKFINSTAFLKEKKSETLPMEPGTQVRKDPVVTKLDVRKFSSIFTNNLRDLAELFRKNNFEIRIAGGAVRDILMGNIPKDVDFATTATPDTMKELFTRENIRMINTRGESHGTITPRINNEENFEITTLRIDRITDGRHAIVEFTTDWQLDANRRDLTINSMFMGFDGTVYDYFYGFDDLKISRVRFVGDPVRRIQEDYLRILRYFRFYGRIAKQPDAHDEKTIEAIKENSSGLKQVSGERIWGELKKIIQGNFGGEMVLKMIHCGIAPFIGLPNEPNTEDFKRVWNESKSFKDPYHPITLLSALLNTPDDALNLHLRLKLSAYERDMASFLTQNREESINVKDILYYQKMCIQPSVMPELIKSYVLELLKYQNKIDFYEKYNNWKIPQFPLTGKQITECGCPIGRETGNVMKYLRKLWADDRFKMTTDDLIKLIPEVMKELNIERVQPGQEDKRISHKGNKKLRTN